MAGGEACRRLQIAEEQGLRLVIACRTVFVAIALVWYILSPILNAGIDPRFGTIAPLTMFTAAGIAHLWVR